jgi:hypothetical protein
MICIRAKQEEMGFGPQAISGGQSQILRKLHLCLLRMRATSEILVVLPGKTIYKYVFPLIYTLVVVDQGKRVQ